jgi:CRISPR locus-related DNA-binding protein
MEDWDGKDMDSSDGEGSVIHIATVGMTPGPVVDGFRAHQGIDLQILLHSPKSAENARRIAEKLEAFAGRRICQMVEIDEFDMLGIIRTILEIWKQHPRGSIFVNISGGTKIMAPSALVACFMIGGKAYYMKEDPSERLPVSKRVIEIPVPKVPLQDVTPKHRKIIKYLMSKGGRLDSASVLGDFLDDTPQLISHHLKVLRNEGLIELQSDGRKKRVILTYEGKLFASIA